MPPRILCARRDRLPPMWQDMIAYATERGWEVVEEPECPPHMVYVEGPVPLAFNIETGEHGIEFPFSNN